MVGIILINHTFNLFDRVNKIGFVMVVDVYSFFKNALHPIRGFFNLSIIIMRF